jgi:hypothetical protein
LAGALGAITSRPLREGKGDGVKQDGQMDYRQAGSALQCSAALADDLGALGDYLAMLGVLLAEKAAELEPSWEAACAAGAEIETLQAFEGAVAERAIALRAGSIAEIRAKLAIWRALTPGAEEADPESARDRLILSVEADLAALDRR